MANKSNCKFGRRSDGSTVVSTNNKPTHGININDKLQPFTQQILDGSKTIETRDSPSLKPYVGKRVGIVRTGVGPATLVGHATIGNPVFYKNKKSFDQDYNKHLVAKTLKKFYIGPKGKWGFPVLDVVPVKPTVLTSQGRVARKLNNAK